MKLLNNVLKVAGITGAVGAATWLGIGLFDYNVINALLGSFPTVERIVYVLAGVGGLMMLKKLF